MRERKKESEREKLAVINKRIDVGVKVEEKMRGKEWCARVYVRVCVGVREKQGEVQEFCGYRIFAKRRKHGRKEYETKFTCEISLLYITYRDSISPFYWIIDEICIHIG